MQQIGNRISVIRITVANADMLVHCKSTNPICIIQAPHFPQEFLQQNACVPLQKLSDQTETALPQSIRQDRRQQVMEAVAPVVRHHDLGPAGSILVVT
eukprot:Skav210866  [mRNA]  locus=scaffold4964:33886:34179:+ [translate_table: standard]